MSDQDEAACQRERRGYGAFSGIYTRTPSAQRGYERRGRFAGRGPKGYRRSDERLKEEVCDRLTADPDIDAGGLAVTVKDGEVTLEGCVLDRQMKRGAEDCIESISGVRQVHNHLRVSSRGHRKASH
jgi:osmotically-inducible protein OsmY